jgi:cell wall-associated NlpC family hydrolase
VLLCACLFAAPALPALAMQPVTPAAGTNAGLHAPAAGTALAAASVAAAPAAAPAIAAKGKPAAAGETIVVLDEPLQMSDRALLLASDINRLIAKPGSLPAGDEAEATTGNRIQSVLQRALTLLGTPYRWGGTTTNGFDCSGLVGYVFRTTLGIELPRVSRDMARTGQEVDRASLVPGDLVFFGRRGRVDHVGIYLGEGRFVHAPRTGREVTVSKLDGYWGRKFLEARRVVAGI